MNALVESEIQDLLSQSNEVIIITSKTDLQVVVNRLRTNKSLQEVIKEDYALTIDLAHKAHKEAIARRDAHIKPLVEAEKKDKAAIVEYNKIQEAEQRERERIANEELAKVAEARKQELLNNAEKSKNEWDAEVLKEQAAAVVPITVDTQENVLEEKGLSIRKTWKARVIDENKVPRAYLLVNESLLNQCAKNESFRETGIAGVEFYCEESASVRI